MFQFADVLAGLAGAVDVLVVPVGSEVVEAGVGIVDQMPGDLQDVVGDGDDRFLLRGVFGDAPVAGADEGFGAGGTDGGFAERGFESAVAFAGAAVAVPGAALDGAG